MATVGAFTFEYGDYIGQVVRHPNGDIWATYGTAAETKVGGMLEGVRVLRTAAARVEREHQRQRIRFPNGGF